MSYKHTRSWIASAITDDRGEVDVGNLGLFMLIALVLGTIPVLCGLAIAASIWPEHKAPIQELGIGVGGVCTGFGAALAALGAYRAGADRMFTPVARPAPNVGQQVNIAAPTDATPDPPPAPSKLKPVILPR